MDSLLARVDRLSLSLGQRKEFVPIQVNKNPSVISDLVSDLFRKTSKYARWRAVDIDEPYTFVELKSGSVDYTILEKKFLSGLKYPKRRVVRIVEVRNPFLYLQYELKLTQKKKLYGYISEKQLYHGTKECNVDSICEKNFDWRKIGANGMRSSKFGMGVSFSPSSQYASDYPRRCSDSPRAMIVAKVMEGHRCNGVEFMVIPPLPADTSVKPGDGNVVVKYFDNEFYPEYIIYYR
ncbi:unnamed protein product [Phaedon cochleariae]|uniref:Poly [ADP-ribose] polymerase n=1 Tax=Phaedon cochleariae TaxID=80249 RepID=A0A9P0DR53_PHACE|nr:unnamed protein product [Phaedon cochleariae]